jgi:hypothetical protein
MPGMGAERPEMAIDAKQPADAAVAVNAGFLLGRGFRRCANK